MENSPTALDNILLAASKFLTSQYTLIKFKNILALSSYPNGSEYFLVVLLSVPPPILSLTPGSSSTPPLMSSKHSTNLLVSFQLQTSSA